MITMVEVHLTVGWRLVCIHDLAEPQFARLDVCFMGCGTMKKQNATTAGTPRGVDEGAQRRRGWVGAARFAQLAR